MTEAEAQIKGLTQIWQDKITRKSRAIAENLVNDLRSKGVEAYIIPCESIVVKSIAVWRDRTYESRLKTY